MQPALKTRLLGAFVIIALIVIVVPLFFSGKPSGGGGQSISLDIPQPPDQKLKTRTLSVAPPSAASQAQNDASSQATVTKPAAGSGQLARVNIPSRVPQEVNPAQSQSAQKSAQSAAPAASESSGEDQSAQAKTEAPAENEKPATDNPGKAANDLYQISLGAYSHESNAKQLVAKVAKLGYQAHVSGTTIGGKPAARVDVGPFDSRARAEAARLKLQAALPRAPAKLESVPTDQQDNAPAEAKPAKQAGGWAVQVVAYSKQADANDLRDRLRKAGFDSYVDDVTSDGRTLWRVRVGPMTGRDDAVSTLKQIKGKFPHLGGVVVTVP